jgi:hypothetical protein
MTSEERPSVRLRPLNVEGERGYSAVTETGAGMFIKDTLAREKARALHPHVEPVAWAQGGSEPR